MTHLGGKVNAGSKPLLGSVEFQDGTSLDLQNLASKLVAVELATLYAGVKDQLEAIAKRAELQIPQEVW